MSQSMPQASVAAEREGDSMMVYPASPQDRMIPVGPDMQPEPIVIGLEALAQQPLTRAQIDGPAGAPELANQWLVAQAAHGTDPHAATATDAQGGLPSGGHAAPGAHEVPAADAHAADTHTSGTAAHGAEGDHGAAHGGPAQQYEMPPFPPNFASWIHAYRFTHDPSYAATFTEHQEHLGHHTYVNGRLEPSHAWFINPLYSIFYALIIIVVVRKALSRASLEKPSRFQSGVEGLLIGLRNFFLNITGPDGAKFFPFIGSLWLFILLNNMMVLVPGFKAPSYSFKTTIALGLCVFCYVHYQSFKYLGAKKWFLHLLGQPTDFITWCMSPLFFVLEAIGMFVKPISLALRLFGNIFGEDKLLASFLGMGMLLVATIFRVEAPPIGVPLHLPFYFLVLLLSTIQATVFSLLTAIYIMQLQPHEHHEEHGEAHGDAHADHGAQPATQGAVI